MRDLRPRTRHRFSAPAALARGARDALRPRLRAPTELRPAPGRQGSVAAACCYLLLLLLLLLLPPPPPPPPPLLLLLLLLILTIVMIMIMIMIIITVTVTVTVAVIVAFAITATMCTTILLLPLLLPLLLGCRRCQNPGVVHHTFVKSPCVARFSIRAAGTKFGIEPMLTEEARAAFDRYNMILISRVCATRV